MADGQAKAPHLSSADFQATLDSAAKDGKPVVVDFYAEWCGPCQIAAPVIDKLSGEYADKAVIAKLNVDENNDIAGQYGVMSIPTVIVFKKNDDGEMEEVHREIGFPGEAKYKQVIDEAVA